MDDKEKIKILIDVINNITYMSKYAVKISAKHADEISKIFIGYSYSETRTLNIALHKFVSKYEDIFRIYGITASNYKIEGSFINYNNVPIYWE